MVAVAGILARCLPGDRVERHIAGLQQVLAAALSVPMAPGVWSISSCCACSAGLHCCGRVRPCEEATRAVTMAGGGQGAGAGEGRWSGEGPLTEELATAEADLAVTRARLEAFTRQHDRMLAPLYAELDEVEAQIAERAARACGRPEDLEDAEAARERARESADAARAMAGEHDRPDESDGRETSPPAPSAQARRNLPGLGQALPSGPRHR